MITTLRKRFSLTSTVRITGRALVVALACLTAAGSSDARAGLTIEIQNFTTLADDTGSFDVILVNDGPTSYSVGSDVVEVAILGATGAKFTDATTATGMTYIYATSFADFLGIPLYAGLADRDLTVVDSEFDVPFYRVVGFGESYGLAHVTFQDDPLSRLSAGMIQVVAEGTSISDESGEIIYPAQAVPEPASLCAFALGVAAIAAASTKRRLAHTLP
ncbi:PEP-CTERM sorting domain-containing protein [Paludisphaera mucosa]|uniref:PEP-CTERM sorting domain-containing protein n=1 Tax=Paludisphaera mucosa TaxID=3030827 RepID=A0ABT6FM01_9BACT|nr:PEP-CTERM sorting domain-containing protein [Paludisphaera mucosa]MDG3008413.1 PEP-CTERM sorting domain-containing protein [Paludisphaera mucosa]